VDLIVQRGGAGSKPQAELRIVKPGKSKLDRAVNNDVAPAIQTLQNAHEAVPLYDMQTPDDLLF